MVKVPTVSTRVLTAAYLAVFFFFFQMKSTPLHLGVARGTVVNSVRVFQNLLKLHDDLALNRSRLVHFTIGPMKTTL